VRTRRRRCAPCDVAEDNREILSYDGGTRWALAATVVVCACAKFGDESGSSDGGSSGGAGPSLSGDPVVVAKAITNPQALALQASTGDLFWVQRDADGKGSVNRVAAGGSASEVVYGGLDQPDLVAVDATHLYWSSADDTLTP
jgi:outer membrane protein assembly factor BamB